MRMRSPALGQTSRASHIRQNAALLAERQARRPSPFPARPAPGPARRCRGPPCAALLCGSRRRRSGGSEPRPLPGNCCGIGRVRLGLPVLNDAGRTPALLGANPSLIPQLARGSPRYRPPPQRASGRHDQGRLALAHCGEVIFGQAGRAADSSATSLIQPMRSARWKPSCRHQLPPSTRPASLYCPCCFAESWPTSAAFDAGAGLRQAERRRRDRRPAWKAVFVPTRTDQLPVPRF